MEDENYLILSDPDLLQSQSEEDSKTSENIDLDQRNSDWEEPVELQGLPDQPDLQRTKYYYSDYEGKQK